MNKTCGVLRIAMFLIGFGTFGWADTFAINAFFTDGGHAIGTFTTDASNLNILTWDYAITGSPSGNFTSSSSGSGQAAIEQPGTYFDSFAPPPSAELLAFSDFGAGHTGNYDDFYLKVPLSAGGTIQMWGALDCAGCGTLIGRDSSIVDQSGSTPEPSAVILFGTILGIFGVTKFGRRKRMPRS